LVYKSGFTYNNLGRIILGQYTLYAQIAECADVGDWYEKCQSS